MTDFSRNATLNGKEVTITYEVQDADSHTKSDTGYIWCNDGVFWVKDDDTDKTLFSLSGFLCVSAFNGDFAYEFFNIQDDRQAEWTEISYNRFEEGFEDLDKASEALFEAGCLALEESIDGFELEQE